MFRSFPGTLLLIILPVLPGGFFREESFSSIFIFPWKGPLRGILRGGHFWLYSLLSILAPPRPVESLTVSASHPNCLTHGCPSVMGTDSILVLLSSLFS